MSAWWTGFNYGVMCLLVAGLIVLLTAMAKAERRGDDDVNLLWAIAERESGNDSKAVGRKGEFTKYQFMRSTWGQYTRANRDDAYRNPSLADAVAQAHLDWLRTALHRGGVRPTAYTLALAWHAGLAATIAGQTKASQRRYAQEVANLYQEANR